ncbi:hypothetical protein Poli38472_000916 [Pythium oligandrum]|uniref:Uncharacterized protein n=1 Tax=Pythium oligandrum TaxID=41045 RepID=A0A8K1CD60_PYTOL|nr:hypothetical protein Poli38472_000916 [Pythium oligandrum]|eukprot:TMW60874.1 hypothetical protein Poli38472_000916 [Pythium oligandrum]
METPERIRAAYPQPANETAAERAKRLASKRAAKYRYFSSTDAARREQNKERQRRRREALDEETYGAIREQNRKRQKARRERMTEDDKMHRNVKQRERRARLDDVALRQLRETEKARARRRRQRTSQRGSSEHDDEDQARFDDEAYDIQTETLAARPRPSHYLPPAASLNTSSFPSSGDLPSLPPSILRSQSVPQHPSIEIAPLQFVLPPASSIQSLTLADRMAPLPQVQNVLPHASTLLNAATTPAASHALSSVSAPAPSSNTSGFSVNSSNAAPPPVSSPVSSAFNYPPSSSTSSSLLGLLLNPSPDLPPSPTPSLVSTQPLPSMSSQHTPALPSLSQLPDFLSATRDLFDGTPSGASSNGFFPSIADFASEFGETESVFRT